jgi:transcriptional regulator
MSEFKTIRDILTFLKSFDFSDYAIIEVCRTRYFTKREKKVFEHYPLYLQHGRTQAEIGYYVNMSQPTVSNILRRCRTKIIAIKNLLKDAEKHLEVIKSVCTQNAYDVLCKALAGTRFAHIAAERNCTVFNISLICSCALRRLKTAAPETYNWVYAFLRAISIVRSKKE